MARFIDLDDGDEGCHDDNAAIATLVQQELIAARTGVVTQPWVNGMASGKSADTANSPKREPKRIWNAITEAFSCWPIALAIAQQIDLNTLDAVARTSYHIHEGLLQYRTSLLAGTLRCSQELVPVEPGESIRFRARAGNWFYMEDGRNYNGKSGDCARDMVGPCRKCGDILCRNCTIKPPAQVMLRERHRRLCRKCAKAPITLHVQPPLDPDTPLTADAVQRALCTCVSEGVWLCQPCGRSIRGMDHEYQRIWRWRSQYGEVLGGLGTGIGDGDRGVICGRESECLAAKEREQEIDCDAEDARDTYTPSTSPTPSPPAASDSFLENELRYERTPSPQLGPGYARHEIEGIGGVVKRKLVRMVKVGACVPEYEDEKGPGRRALSREIQGLERSWCGWCFRIIPGKKDLEPGELSSDEELHRAMSP